MTRNEPEPKEHGLLALPWEPIRFALQRNGVPVDQLDDQVQEIMVRILATYPHKTESPTELRCIAWRIVRNLIVDLHRERWRKRRANNSLGSAEEGGIDVEDVHELLPHQDAVMKESVQRASEVRKKIVALKKQIVTEQVLDPAKHYFMFELIERFDSGPPKSLNQITIALRAQIAKSHPTSVIANCSDHYGATRYSRLQIEFVRRGGEELIQQLQDASRLR